MGTGKAAWPDRAIRKEVVAVGNTENVGTSFDNISLGDLDSIFAGGSPDLDLDAEIERLKMAAQTDAQEQFEIQGDTFLGSKMTLSKTDETFDDFDGESLWSSTGDMGSPVESDWEPDMEDKPLRFILDSIECPIIPEHPEDQGINISNIETESTPVQIAITEDIPDTNSKGQVGANGEDAEGDADKDDEEDADPDDLDSIDFGSDDYFEIDDSELEDLGDDPEPNRAPEPTKPAPQKEPEQPEDDDELSDFDLDLDLEDFEQGESEDGAEEEIDEQLAKALSTAPVSDDNDPDNEAEDNPADEPAESTSDSDLWGTGSDNWDTDSDGWDTDSDDWDTDSDDLGNKTEFNPSSNPVPGQVQNSTISTPVISRDTSPKNSPAISTNPPSSTIKCEEPPQPAKCTQIKEPKVVDKVVSVPSTSPKRPPQPPIASTSQPIKSKQKENGVSGGTSNNIKDTVSKLRDELRTKDSIPTSNKPIPRPPSKASELKEFGQSQAQKSPTYHFDVMQVEELNKVVREFLIGHNVKKAPVDRTLLEQTFGKDNISNLLKKSYLIAIGKNITSGL